MACRLVEHVLGAFRLNRLRREWWKVTHPSVDPAPLAHVHLEPAGNSASPGHDSKL